MLALARTGSSKTTSAAVARARIQTARGIFCTARVCRNFSWYNSLSVALLSLGRVYTTHGVAERKIWNCGFCIYLCAQRSLSLSLLHECTNRQQTLFKYKRRAAINLQSLQYVRRRRADRNIRSQVAEKESWIWATTPSTPLSFIARPCRKGKCIRAIMLLKRCKKINSNQTSSRWLYHKLQEKNTFYCPVALCLRLHKNCFIRVVDILSILLNQK